MMHWLSFLTYAVITAATPGPNNIMSMSQGSRKGFKRALPFNFGIWAGFSVVMVLCTVFCTLLTTWIPKIKLPMLALGAGYMLYLAWQSLRLAWKEQEVFVEEAKHEGFFSGLFLQFINPKIYIYGILSMEAYILPHYEGQTVVLLAFALLLAGIGFVFTLCWSAFGAIFKRMFSKHAKGAGVVMALLLVACAVSLFVT